jgi:hypothetical protein
VRASAIAAMSASMVLAATFRSRALSLAKNGSMGLKSGLYGLDGFADAGDFCGWGDCPSQRYRPGA